jgi:hypothetical protein
MRLSQLRSSGRPGMSEKWRHRKSVDFSIASSVHSSLLFGLDGPLQKRSRAVAKTSISGSARCSRRESWKTRVSVWAYHSLSGEVEASNTPTIRRLTPHAVTNFRA